MAKLFLSYRRSDRYAAGLLRAEIVRRLGSSRLFMDTTDLDAGVHFPSETDAAVADASTVLALIGDGWTSEVDRLAEPDDWVRRELEAAARHGKRIVPVLLDDATLPDPDDLPESIRGITDAQAYRVTSDRLERDVGDLLTSLGERRSRTPIIAALAAVFVLVVGVAVLWPSQEGSALSFLNTQLVFDASDGMTETIPSSESGSKAKSDVARDRIRDYVETRDGDRLALRVADSCGNPGELVVPFQTKASGRILGALEDTSFTGDRFPLAAAIIAATADFNDPEAFPAETVEKQIIVFTTTGATCEDDPSVALGERWDELGEIRLSVELIGLGIEEGTDEADRLRRTAAAVDGRAFPVATAEELDRVLRALLEVEPVQQAAQEVSDVGNGIVDPLRELQRGFQACDYERAATAASAAEDQVDAAGPALDALEGRDQFEAFAAVHAAGATWAESLADVIPAGEALMSRVDGVEDEAECDELRRSDDWGADVATWNEAVGGANAALSALREQNRILSDELLAILEA